ncbi:Uncharacterised protein [uncultured archaeon]|nr:Uncharacterised protein [uncultured archaeon]
MKNLKIFTVLTMLVMLFPLAACNKPSPASPAKITQPQLPQVQACIVDTWACLGTNCMPSSKIAIAYIVDGNGAAVTNAAVTLSWDTWTLELPCIGTGSSSGINQPGMTATSIDGGVYRYVALDSSISGKSCTLSVATGGSTYTTTFTCIDGSPSIVSGASGVTCSWNPGVGNFNTIAYNDNGATTNSRIGPPIPSNPYILSSGVFTFPGNGNSSVGLYLWQEDGFSGLGSNSFILTNKTFVQYY